MEQSNKPTLVSYVLGILMPIMMSTIYLILRNNPILSHSMIQLIIGLLLGLSLIPSFLLFVALIVACPPYRQKALLASSILGCVGSILLILLTFKLPSLETRLNILGESIAKTVIAYYIPSMLIIIVAVILNIVAYLKNNFVLAVIAGIIFSIMFLSLLTIPLLILCFMGASNIKSASTNNIAHLGA